MSKFKTYNSHTSGFSLVELLIVISLISLLLALAIPSFRSLIQNNRAIALSGELVQSLQLARNEAITRATNVSVCPASDNSFSVCGGASSWTNGWIVFVDPDGDGVLAANTDRLQVQDGLAQGSSVVTALGRITFSNTGFVSNGVGTLSLSAAECEGNNGRSIAVNNTGRVAVSPIACP